MRAARGRRGVVLLAVLWVLAVLALLAVEFAAAARTTRAAAANTRAEARVRWGARAGLARARELLDRTIAGNFAGYDLAARGDSALPMPSFDLDGVTVRVAALDARARIQLNRADAAVLSRLFDAAGLASSAADSLADAILDWRDGDAFRRPRGAEAAEYRAARRAVAPKDAPFEAVEELRAVYGMSPARYAAIARYLTVAGDGRVSVNSAPVPVLLTVPGIDEAGAAAIVRRRARAPVRGIFDLLLALPEPSRSRVQERMAAVVDRIAFSPRALEIRSVATVPGTPIRAETRAVVLLSGASAVSVRQVVER